MIGVYSFKDLNEPIFEIKYLGDKLGADGVIKRNINIVNNKICE